MNLPAECLIKIGSYADAMTVHAMLRTSKEIKEVMEGSRVELPKCDIGLELDYNQSLHQITFNIVIMRMDVETRSLVAHFEDDNLLYTEDEKRNLVAGFYETNADHQVAEQTFPIGLTVALDMHLDYILKKVHFSQLSLVDLSAEQNAVVYRQIQRHQTKVDKMELLPCEYQPLTAIPPANVVNTMNISYPFEGFYRLPSIRLLYGLVVDHCEDCLLKDDDLVQLRAQEIVIESGGWQISERGISTFIRQWCKSKREIKSVRLESEEEASDGEQEKWLRMVRSLDPRLVRVSGYADNSMNSSLELTRLSDEVELVLDWEETEPSMASIRIYDPTVDS